MEPVAEAMMSFVVTLAAASYGHFGVTLKDGPALHRQHTQRTPQTVQRIPAATAAQPVAPTEQTVAERIVVVRKV
jgi:hypothetical protein